VNRRETDKETLRCARRTLAPEAVRPGGTLGVYRFDDVRVDVASFRVERNGEAVPLEPKAFDLLVLLLERQGQLVTKQEILDRVWRQTAVTDNALTRIVANLRKALGDDARDSRYIETVPTRGYRWLVPVQRDESTPIAVADRRARPPRRATWLAAAALIVVIVCAAVLVRRARLPMAGAMPGPALGSLWPTQITFSPRLDAFPALAPNGRALAYASDRSGGFEIVVKALTAGGGEMALTSDGQQNVQPAWSPDGDYVAYHSMRRGGVWIVPALGGAPRQVSAFGSKPAWSPDGRRLAFQSDPLADIGPTAYGANVPSTIWTVARDGGDLRRLTESTQPIGGHASPAWSPDGRRIAFVTYSAAPARLWSVPAAGGPATLLVEGHIPIHDPVFTPDGSALYYATGAPFIVRVPLSAETGLPQGEGEEIATPGLPSARHISISGDGRRLAMAALSMSSNLWSVLVAPDTGAALKPPAALTDDTLRRKTTPVFSPDGEWIAFSASRGGAGSDVWVIHVKDGRTIPVTAGDPTMAKPTAPSYFRASWLPDSTRVAFLANDGTRTTLQTADLTSRRPQPLLELRPVAAAAELRRSGVNPTLDFRLSPDGRELAFSEIDTTTGMPRLYVRPVDGGDARALSPPDHPETYPVWSPDGRWIATEVRTDEGSLVGVRAARGGPLRRLTGGLGQSWIHTWAPGSDRVLFAGQRGGVWNIWWVSRATGRESPVTNFTGVDTFVRYPAWSPSGDRIVFENGQVRGNIWVSMLRDSTESWPRNRTRTAR
jgi:Tol biopolymer transport system component/DNA-binding winged helix-turn-helix (wHTH) protein